MSPTDNHPSHRHRHHSYEAHLRRNRRRQLHRRLLTIAAALLAVVVFAFLMLVAFCPDMLAEWTDPGVARDRRPYGTATPDANLMQRYDGLDISHHQGTIDWQKVGDDKAIQFVYIKATEGGDFVDRCYARNLAGAKSVGIAVGAYHYLTSGSSAHAQFRNFYGVVDRKAQDVVPMVDVEEEGVRGWTRRQMQDSLAVFIQLVEKHYLCSPIIYSYAKFYNANLASHFNGYRLFLAHYDTARPVVAGNGRHDIWQHTDRGSIDGIGCPVDLDVFSEGTSLHDIMMPPYRPLPHRARNGRR